MHGILKLAIAVPCTVTWFWMPGHPTTIQPSIVMHPPAAMLVGFGTSSGVVRLPSVNNGGTPFRLTARSAWAVVADGQEELDRGVGGARRQSHMVVIRRAVHTEGRKQLDAAIDADRHHDGRGRVGRVGADAIARPGGVHNINIRGRTVG